MGGSGTIFITGCTLRCSFCQNYQISHQGMGLIVSPVEFASICMELESQGAENINIVTGSHAVPAIVEGLKAARHRGLMIPALWNSSAYESVEAIEAASEHLAVYLPDLKTLDSEISARYFKAPDYPEVASRAILRMAELREIRFGPCRNNKKAEAEREGKAMINPDPELPEILESGVIVRHLVLPDRMDSTRKVIEWFARNLNGRALLSVMMQYTPVSAGPTPDGKDPHTEAPPSSRFVDEREYETVLGMLEDFDISDGFYQELVPSDDWLPDFERENPFSSELSIPIWHWKTGFIA